MKNFIVAQSSSRGLGKSEVAYDPGPARSHMFGVRAVGGPALGFCVDYVISSSLTLTRQ
jgi:hypothetical protein